MARKREANRGCTQRAWDYLHDCAEDDHPHGLEYFMLESNALDLQTGYRTQDIWERHRDEILADWAVEHPGTRPLCWWRFDSGLERTLGPMKLTENITANRVLHSWRDSVPKDQRAWLAEHGALEAGE